MASSEINKGFMAGAAFAMAAVFLVVAAMEYMDSRQLTSMTVGGVVGAALLFSSGLKLRAQARAAKSTKASSGDAEPHA